MVSVNLSYLVPALILDVVADDASDLLQFKKK